MPGPGAIVRRRLIEDIGGWDPALRFAPDYEWYLRAGLVGPFKRVPLPLARWRAHPDATSFSSRGEARARELVHIAETFFARTDLAAEIQAVRAEAFRNAYLVAGLNVAEGLDGPGSRFQVVDTYGGRVHGGDGSDLRVGRAQRH